MVAAILSALVLAGCGEGEAPSKPDMTPKTQTDAGKAMLGDQMKSTKLKEKSPAK
jgi:hypothetical protein